MSNDSFHAKRTFSSAGRNLEIFDITGLAGASDLPFSLKILLENLLRHEDGAISAEKGYLRETGNLLFHLSLILILVGVSVGSLFGMRGEAIVNKGERFISVPTSYDTLSFGKLVNE